MNTAEIQALGKRLTDNLNKIIVGKESQIFLAVTTLFAGGHLLFEAVPLHTSAGNHKFQAELQSYIHKLRLWICNRLTLNSNNIIHII